MIIKKYEAPLLQYPEFRAHKQLLQWVPPALVVLGTVGNVLAFVVLTRPAMRRCCSYVYLAMLAVVDTVVLYVGLFRLWLGEVRGSDVRDLNNASCKLINIVGYSSSDISVWIIIAVTFERYLVVCRPLKLLDLYDTRRAFKVLAAILALLVSLHLHFCWTVQVVYFPYDNELIAQCAAGQRYVTLIEEVWPWVDALVYSFIPFVIILLLNSCIIVQITKATKLRRAMTSPPTPTQQYARGSSCSSGYSSSTRRSQLGRCDSGKLTVMLLTISFAFLLTTLPANIALIVSNVWTPDPHNLHQLSRLRLCRTVTELLMYLNHSCNFYLYCATGRKFRMHLCRLFRLHKYACGYMDVQVLHTNKPHTCPTADPRGSRASARHLVVPHQQLQPLNEAALKHLCPPPNSSGSSSSRSPNNLHAAAAPPFKRSKSSFSHSL